jgi:Na+-transporting methylmalonyl-CoA/oxaloacetate decarboxylase gamma subunit
VVTTRPSPRTGAVVWGTVLLMVAVVAFVVAMFGLEALLSAPVTSLIIAFGAIFVFLALVIVIVRAASRAVPASAAEVASAPEPSAEPTRAPRARRTAKDQPVD